MTLAEFLLARIAEDEAVARAGWTRGAGMPNLPQGWVDEPTEELVAYNVRFSPTRVVAECEAKRRIIEWASVKVARFTPSLDTPPRFAAVTFCDGRVYADPRRQVDITDEYHRWLDEHSGYAHSQVLQWLALSYADHPDYDESWRP